MWVGRLEDQASAGAQPLTCQRQKPHKRVVLEMLDDVRRDDRTERTIGALCEVVERIGLHDGQARFTAARDHALVLVHTLGGDPFVAEQCQQLTTTAPDFADWLARREQREVVPQTSPDKGLTSAKDVFE